MATIRCDAVVLGSTLGGLVAATYLARSRLRVVLIAEDTHAKRCTLLRQPFFLSGLESGGRIMRVLQELALPLIEQRRIQRDPVALQVILPEARIDIPRGAGALARELEAHGLAEARRVRAWLDSVDAQGARAQAKLWERPALARPGARRRLLPHGPPDTRVEIHFPPPPGGIEEVIGPQIEALCTLDPASRSPARALLLRSTREGGFRGPHTGFSFLSLLEGRFRTLHGEIHPVPSFELVRHRGDVGVELPRGCLMARALVIAVPREPLRRFLGETSSIPSWLEPGLPPRATPARLFRVVAGSMPTGMAARVIRADGSSPAGIHWLARTRDDTSPETEWIVAAGPGAALLETDDPLGSLAPFSRGSIVPADPGPTPRWDRDATEMRFPQAETPAWLRQRPLVAVVGPELAPGLGFEGEVLCARRVALHLAERLGSRRRMP